MKFIETGNIGGQYISPEKFEEAIEQRWQKVRDISMELPNVRQNELEKTLENINPQQGEKILEIGSGGGFLTFPMAQRVGDNGRIVTADVFEKGLQDVAERNSGTFPIETHLYSGEYQQETKFPNEFHNNFDGIVSLATMHHFDNRDENTGHSGKINALNEFYQMLKKGGRLAITDIMDNTITQQYFDAIDDPEHFFPTAHPHDFFKEDDLEYICRDIGFKKIQIETSYVPWKFENPNQAEHYIHQLHNAQCSPQESFEIAKNILGFKLNCKGYVLGWELGFLTCEK